MYAYRGRFSVSERHIIELIKHIIGVEFFGPYVFDFHSRMPFVVKYSCFYPITDLLS